MINGTFARVCPNQKCETKNKQLLPIYQKVQYASINTRPANVNTNDHMNDFNHAVWKVFHLYAVNYPMNPSKSRQEEAKQFYAYLGMNHPCTICSKHYTEMFTKSHVFNADTREKLFQWTVFVHNMVNQRLNKQQVSLQQAKLMYNFN